MKSKFLRNVSSLALGTVASQFVVIVSSPLLTRLYTVESFGLFSLFTSVFVIFGVFTTARYEFAIGIPENEKKAIEILKLIIGIGFICSILLLFFLIITREFFDFQNKLELFKTKWIYLAPIYSFFIALNTGLLYWLQRIKSYKKISIANALQVIITTLISVVLGYYKFIEAGMIIALVLGVIITSFYLLYQIRGLKSPIKVTELRKVAKEFVSFPKFLIISDLSLTISQQFTPIIFSNLFSTLVVGYYSLANRMLRLPNIVITTAIGSVFRNEAIDEIRITGNCRTLYFSTLKKLVFLSLPIYALIFFISPIVFAFFFGEKWLIAGKMAQILSLMLMVEFIALPLNSVFSIRNKQKIYSRIQFFNMLSGIFALYLGSMFDNFYLSLIFYSFSNFIFNIILLRFSYKFSK